MSTGSSKPTIVLVHGAFHTASHFDGLYRELRKAGYVVTVPTLPSIAQKPAVQSQEPDRQAIRDAIDTELDIGNNVIVLAHSYGGIPTASALEGRSKTARQRRGLDNGVLRFIGLSTFLLDVGVSIAKLNPDGVEKGQQDVVDDFYLRPEANARAEFYSSQTKEMQDRAIGMTRPMSWHAFLDETTYAPWKDEENKIPMTYIVCENDCAIPPQAQEAMATAAGVEEILRTPSDHSPMLDKPEWVARALRYAAGEPNVKL